MKLFETWGTCFIKHTKMVKLFSYLLFFIILFTGCKKDTYQKPAGNMDTTGEKKSDTTNTKQKSSMTIKSTAFNEGGMIPKKYSCEGENLSPPLEWSDSPAGTNTFALIVDDPDAPAGTWVHWVVYNIPASTLELKDDMSSQKTSDSKIVQGINDFKKASYGGPCPPSGTHRYFFKLYAIDAKLDLAGDVTKDKLLDAMKGHVLGQAQLIGKYTKGG